MNQHEMTNIDQSSIEANDSYDVFISYSRVDSEFSRYLEKALESYNAPKSLQLNQRRLRVFRDEQDLTGHDYLESIKSCLHRSSKLIIICSPMARASQYVDQEIEIFLKNHSPADLIPVLLDGIPNNEATDADDRKAFPEQLYKVLEIPLAVDYRGSLLNKNKIRKEPFENAWYTLLANIHGIDRATLEQRDRMRRQRARRIVIAITTAIIISLAGAAVFSWLQMLTAEQQRDIALRGFARYLATQSDTQRKSSQESALLLAVEATRTTYDLNGSVTVAAELALRKSLAQSGGIRLGVDSRQMGFSADGHWLARTTEKGIVTVWDLSTPAMEEQSLTLTHKLSGTPTFGPHNELCVITNDGKAILLDPSNLNKKPQWIEPRTGKIQQVVFNPTARKLLVIDDSPEVVLHDLDRLADNPVLLRGHKSRRPIGKFKGVNSANFGANGDWLITTASDKNIRLWNLKSPEVKAFILIEDKFVWGKTFFSTDEKWLGAVLDYNAKTWSERLALWHLEGDTPVRIKVDNEVASGDGPALIYNQIAGFNSTQNQLVTATKKGAIVWKLTPENAQVELRIDGHLNALSQDGRYLAMVKLLEDDRTVYEISTWDLNSLKRIDIIKLRTSILAFQFSANNKRLIALTENNELRSWHLEEGQFTGEQKRFTGAKGNTLLVSKNAQAIITSQKYSSKARLWNITNPGTNPVLLNDIERSAELKRKTRTGSSGGKPDGGLQQMLAFDPHNQRVALPLNGGKVKIINLTQPHQSANLLQVDESGISAITFSPDGKTIAVGDRHSTVRLWHVNDLTTPYQTLLLPSPEKSYSSLSVLKFSHDGKQLAAAGGFGTVTIWKLAALDKDPIQLSNNRGWIMAAEFSANDEDLLVSGMDGKVSIVNLNNSKQAKFLEGHDGAAHGQFLSGNQQVITIGFDTTIRIWQLDNKNSKPRVLRGHSNNIASFTMSNNHSRLFTVSRDGSLRIWNLNDLNSVETAHPVKSLINVITVSENGLWLATGNHSGGVAIWRMDAMELGPMIMPVPLINDDKKRDSEVWALKFSHDNKWLIALTNGAGWLWNMQTKELISNACSISGRNLTIREWEAHLADLPYRLSCIEWGLPENFLQNVRREAEQGTFERSVRWLERAVILDKKLRFEPTAEATRIAISAHFKRARKMVRRKKPDAAKSVFLKIMQLDPKLNIDPVKEIERVQNSQKLIKEAQKKALKGEMKLAEDLYRKALTLDPDLDIDPVQEAGKIYAPVVKKEAQALARKGQIKEAVKRLEQALDYDPKIISNEPKNEAFQVWSWALLNEGKKLAKEGLLNPAIQKMQDALKINPHLRIQPHIEAKKLVAKYLAGKSDKLRSKRDFATAIKLFHQAKAMDPTVSISSYDANELCWLSLKSGLTKNVSGVCDHAVEKDPKRAMFRDSRGVARVLSGDISGAIPDFEFYVKNSRRKENIKLRKQWIERLHSGWQPASFAELNEP